MRGASAETDASDRTRPVAGAPGRGLPAAVWVLGAAVFCLGTTEFVVAGLEPHLGRDLHVSTADVGTLIAVFALSVAIGGPIATAVCLRHRPRPVLITLLAVFIAGQTLAAASPTYAVLATARVITAVADGAFFGIGAVVAISLASRDRQARAIAVMFGGLTVSNVAGVPLGTALGDLAGWRATFWLIDALSVLSLVGVLATVSGRLRLPSHSLRAELRVLRQPILWPALATTALSQAGLFAAFSYLSPLLTDISGLPEKAVPVVLVLFGVGSVLGTTLGGRWADAHLATTLHWGLALLSAMLLALTVTAPYPAAAVPVVGAFGFAAFVINPALQTRAMRLADGAPALASSANISAFNVGNTVGPLAGGAALTAGTSPQVTTVIGAGFALISLLVATLTTRAVRTRPRGAPTALGSG